MLFVDTGAWFALSVASDPDHERAKAVVAENDAPLITTDYVVDELLTLFVVRRQRLKGVEWVHDILDGQGVDLIRITTDDFEEACRIYMRFSDKEWSFTDCTSYVAMRRMQLPMAFSFDAHFHEFGTVQVVP